MSTSDLEARLRKIREDQQAAVKAHAGAVARREQAEHQLEAETGVLRDLGFETVEEAREFAKKAESEIAEALSSIEAKVRQ